MRSWRGWSSKGQRPGRVHLHLDSGLGPNRADAHRFYFRHPAANHLLGARSGLSVLLLRDTHASSKLGEQPILLSLDRRERPFEELALAVAQLGGEAEVLRCDSGLLL